MSAPSGSATARCGSRRAEAEINGKVVDEAVSERACAAASAAVDPQDDIHASGAYRKSLIGTHGGACAA